MTVITVARQIGSRGDWIAEEVATRLGYEFVDRRLVEEIAGITDTSAEEVERYDEKGDGLVATKDGIIPGSRYVELEGLDHSGPAMAQPEWMTKYQPGPLTVAMVALALKQA